MIKTAAFTLTATLLAVASPAFASGAKPAEAAAQPAETTSVVSKLAPKPVRYCIVDQVTGSRIPMKECRSREDWQALGFDPIAK